ncbi:TPA: hypothetical protein ACX6RY_001987 [Photobacterium damselae]
MFSQRLTSQESHELACIVHEIGARNALLILKNSKRKNNLKNKIRTLPPEVKAKIAAMLCAYHEHMTQKDLLVKVNLIIEEAGLPPNKKISKTAFNRFLNEI